MTGIVFVKTTVRSKGELAYPNLPEGIQEVLATRLSNTPGGLTRAYCASWQGALTDEIDWLFTKAVNAIPYAVGEPVDDDRVKHRPDGSPWPTARAVLGDLGYVVKEAMDV